MFISPLSIIIMLLRLIPLLLLAAATSTSGAVINQRYIRAFHHSEVHVPRDDKTSYTIFPKDSLNTEDFENKLFNTVSQDSVYTSVTCSQGVIFWETELTSAQVSSLQDSSVSSSNDLNIANGEEISLINLLCIKVTIIKLGSDLIKRDNTDFDPFGDAGLSKPAPGDFSIEGYGTLLFKRDDDIVSETDATDNMKVVSTPRGAALADQNGYRYRSSAGSKSTVYTIDSGFDPAASKVVR
jgi:hypothetical protein